MVSYDTKAIYGEIMLSQQLKEFRLAKGLTQQELANLIGVKKITIVRWENGTSKPSALAAEKLESLGNRKLELHETKQVSEPRINLVSKDNLRSGVKEKIKLQNTSNQFTPSSFVVNGPSDQLNFFNKLYDLQENSPLAKSSKEYPARLSTVESVVGLCDRTSQSLLENPSVTAKHWNANYGSHGWHRYVGRFPSHLVRALINHFGLKSGDLLLDPFLGSGTTLVESRLLGIKAIGIEISPLSCMIARTKSQFPESASNLEHMLEEFADFYQKKISLFLKNRSVNQIDHAEVLKRKGNLIPDFPNYQRWLTPEALLGVSIVVEFASKLDGYEKDFVCCALSSKMRSIGNVDVDVVRAEYSKKPRINVDVFHLVQRAMRKYILDIQNSIESHNTFIAPPNAVQIINGSVLDTKISRESIDGIITSPPYGIESLSYFRTHLLSFRCLSPFLNYDPYSENEKSIGSEFLSENNGENVGSHAAKRSKSFQEFFDSIETLESSKYAKRRDGMKRFFDDMSTLADRFSNWLRPGGRIAFVVGNKKLGEEVIPTEKIITELFDSFGLRSDEIIEHKLKWNNSNSEVPWQEKIIQNEYVMLFTKRK